MSYSFFQNKSTNVPDKSPKQEVVSITYEEIGLFPRSFSRVLDRFLKQVFSDVENLVIQEYRFYRYLFLTTFKCLLILFFVPFLVNFLAKTYVVRPLTEYFWNGKQTEIFLNSYQQKRAFAELKDFEEKLYFESLIYPKSAYSFSNLQSSFEDFSLIINTKPDSNNSNSYSQAFSSSSPLSPIGSPGPPESLPNQQRDGSFAPGQKEQGGANSEQQPEVRGNQQGSEALLIGPFTVGPLAPKPPGQISRAGGSGEQSSPNGDPTPVAPLGLGKAQGVKGEGELRSPWGSEAPPKHPGFASGGASPLTPWALPNPPLPPTEGGGWALPRGLGSEAPHRLRGGPKDQRETRCPEGALFLKEAFLKEGSFPPLTPSERPAASAEGKGSKAPLTPWANQQTSPTQPAPNPPEAPLRGVGFAQGLGELCSPQAQRAGCLGGQRPPRAGQSPGGWGAKLPTGFGGGPSLPPPPPYGRGGHGANSTESLINAYTLKSSLFVYQTIETDKNIQQRYQEKTIELAQRYNDQSIEAITNFFTDLISLLTLFYLLYALEIQINITKSFLLEVFFGLDDSKKSLLILLVTDLLVGYHSSNLWELLFEFLFNHYGLPESQTGIFLLVATLPVLLDVLFKYLIFRHLNRSSPATVATYHAMIE
jgi:hypothetical protein